MSDLEHMLGGGEQLAATRTKARGPEGRLPITPEMLLTEPSGNLFGMTQDAGMGWNPADVNRAQVLIVSTQGGRRSMARTPVRSRRLAHASRTVSSPWKTRRRWGAVRAARRVAAASFSGRPRLHKWSRKRSE